MWRRFSIEERRKKSMVYLLLWSVYFLPSHNFPKFNMVDGKCEKLWVIHLSVLWSGGERGRIREAPPVRDVVGELIVRYHRIIKYKSYFYGFQRNAFPQICFSAKGFSTKCFQQNALHKIQEKHDGEKARKTRLLILSVGRYCTVATTWYLSGLAEKQ